jgi:5-methylcytosine-specific restriction endonuclease McrA
MRNEVLARDPQCTYVDEQGVRCPVLATDIHHVIDAVEWIAMGNDFHDPTNLAGLCHAHHSSETAKRNAAAKAG